MPDSVLIQEPLLAVATSEIATVALGIGPQGKDMHAEIGVPRRDTLVDSVDFGVSESAPAGGTVLASIEPGVAGVYDVTVNLSIQGDAADMGNVELKVNSTPGPILAPGTSPVFRKNLGATDLINIVTRFAATAGSQYTLTVSVKQVN